MQDIINTLQEPQNAMRLLLALAILIVVTTLVLYFKKREVRLQDELDDLREEMRAAETKETEDEAKKQLMEAQESTQAQLKGLNETMLHTMSEVGRTLQGQMDSFQLQVNSMGLKEEQRMDAMRRLVDERMHAYEQRMQQTTTTLDAKLQEIQRLNDEQMKAVRETVGDNLDRRLNDSFRVVSERLEKVYQGLGEMQSLAEGVGDLRKVLSNVKVRGIWGETQLGALLEQMLAPSQYEKNVAVSPDSRERVEFAVRMPGAGDETVYLPIDAKFPQSDYERMMDAAESGDAAAVEAAGKQLESVLYAEARKIHEKYIKPPYTTDFALMFLPVEGLYAEVLRRQGLQERMQNEFRVIIAGPTTLAALLNSLQMGFRSMAIEQRTSEVWELLGQVKTEFNKFSGVVDEAQSSIQRASGVLEKVKTRTRVMGRKLSEVEAIATDGEEELLLDKNGEDSMREDF